MSNANANANANATATANATAGPRVGPLTKHQLALMICWPSSRP
jgi:hypothetical protein